MPDDDDYLLQLSTAGITRLLAAQKIGRDIGTLRDRVAKLGLSWVDPPRRVKVAKPRGSVPPPWTDDDDRRLAEFAAAGRPIGLTANEMDRSYNTVRRHAARLGLTFERDRFSRTRHRQAYS